jgi:hypothetical protein
MINKENWKELISINFNEIFDIDIYEIRLQQSSLFIRKQKSAVLGFCMFSFYETPTKKHDSGLYYMYDDGISDILKVKVYDELHIKNILEYEFIEQQLNEKRKIILNYGVNLGLRRDLKINSILDE